MHGKVKRTDKLNGEFQKDIYEIISRRLKNPYITEMFTILRVDTSKDLSHAKVYISIYSKDEGKKATTFKAISDDAKRIRYELSKISNIRTVPELHFILDESLEYSDKINRLFDKIEKGEN